MVWVSDHIWLWWDGFATKEEGPCSCYSFSTVADATSSTSTDSCLCMDKGLEEMAGAAF